MIAFCEIFLLSMNLKQLFKKPNEKLIKLLIVLIFFVTFHPAVFGYDKKNNLVSPEAKKRLEIIEKKRRDLQNKLNITKKKEKIAILKLNNLKTQLNKTQHQLKSSKTELNKTASDLDSVQVNISQTQNKCSNFSNEASFRLKQIYEGHRLGFIEMLFQVDSLPNLLDYLYYQEKIAEQDRKLLQSLRVKSLNLNKTKNILGLKKSWLLNLVDSVSQKAQEIFQATETQEQTAKKLESQRQFYEKAEKQLEIESKNLEASITALEHKYEKSNTVRRTGTGRFKLPIIARMSCPFGWRVHPIFRTRKFHTGVDLAGPNRTPVHAADNGHVLYSGWYGGYGRVVIISHGANLSTLYAHMSKIAVNTGDNVNQGDVVGYEGTTGYSTGPHVHFEVRLDGKPQNPLNYVKN